MLPSDLALQLELTALSSHLYACVGKEGDIGPSYSEWDRLRDPRYPQGRRLLKVFGLPQNKEGWAILLNAYGFLAPTLKDIQEAAYRRPKPQLPSRSVPDDDYPVLHGTTREEITYEDLGNGYYRKTTRTVTSLR